MARKEQNREKLKQWKREQELRFLKSLPLPKRVFQRLMNYLNVELGENQCQHNYRLSNKFLIRYETKVEDHIQFFIDHGGGCDCEILANMDELFEKIDSNINYSIPQNRKILSTKLDSLKLKDFVIDEIPKPWKLRQKGKGYEFLLGKNKEIILKKIKVVNNKNWMASSYWEQRWNKYNRNELEGSKDVSYITNDKYEYVITKSKIWSPAYVWIRPKGSQKWLLEFHTNSVRLKSDLNDLHILLNKIKEC